MVPDASMVVPRHVAGGVCVVVGAAMIVLGWWGASGSAIGLAIGMVGLAALRLSVFVDRLLMTLLLVVTSILAPVTIAWLLSKERWVGDGLIAYGGMLVGVGVFSAWSASKLGRPKS